MKRILKKLLLFPLCAALLLNALAFSASAAGTTSYDISSPYEKVDWDTWHAYKTQFHCHTIASDGDIQLNDVVEMSYSLNYDILAITDHAILNRGWDTVPQTVPLFRLAKYERTQMADVIPLTEERYQEILNGVGRDGNGMLDVPLGVELNGAVPGNSHLTGYFAEYGQGLMGVDGDYETPVRENGEAGGITMLSHLGNYIEYSADLYPEQWDSEELQNYFANIFLKYPSCVGTDIDSGTDAHTYNDRYFYDQLLQKTIPNGRTPWCFTFSDAHQLGQYDRAFTYQLMTELTNDELRRSMEEGTMFCIARYAQHELGADFVGDGPVPMVTRVTIDHGANSITIDAENTDKIVWVANGVEIATGNTIDLNDYEDQITCYVRAYMTGSGGCCFLEPFTIKAQGTEYTAVEVPDQYLYPDFLRDLVTVLDKLVFQNSLLVKLFKEYGLGLA